MTGRNQDQENTDGQPDAHTEPVASSRVTMTVIDGRLTAVKRAGSDDPAATARLRREAEVIRSLSHPNAVELVDVREGDEGLELLMGAAGRHSLAGAAPRSVANVAAIAVDLLTLVTEFHDAGVTHGALGADHVVVGPSGRLTLVSFGRGTPAGGSAAEHGAGVRNDLAAFGATIAHLVFLLPDDLDRSERRRCDKLLAVASRLRDQPTTAAAARALDDLVGLSAGSRRVTSERTPGHLPRTTRELRRPPASRPTRPRGAPPPRLSAAAGQGEDEDEERLRVAPTLAAGTVAMGGMWMMGGPPGRALSGASAADGDLIVAVMEGVRVLAMLGALYLIVISALCLAARYSGSRRLTRIAAAAAPRWLRRTAVGLVGAGVVAGLAPTTPSPTSRTEATTSSERDEPPGTTTAEWAVTSTTASPTTVSPTTTEAPETPAATTPRREQPSATVDRPLPAPMLVAVESGDHLWSIAARALEGHLGRSPNVVEIDPYWRAVIEVNRDALADPENPDLLFRGQVLELPPFDAV